MNKLIMALALVLTPFFFASDSHAVDIPDGFDFSSLTGVAPEIIGASIIQCNLGGNVDLGKVQADGVDLTNDQIKSACQSKHIIYLEGHASYKQCSSSVSVEVLSPGVYKVKYKAKDFRGLCTVDANSTVAGGGSLDTQTAVKVCPPTDSPLYNYSFDSDEDGETDVCYNLNDIPDEEEEEKQCGEGYYQYKVYNNAGEGQCVPVSCSAEGSTQSIWAKGSIYGNTDGTYCNGSCASTVSGGQNDSGYSGTLAIKATSTGSACGGGRPDDSWFDSGNGDECQTTTASSGVSFLKCPVGDGGGESPESPDSKIDLGENKLSETDIPSLIPIVEVCAAGDPSCEIRNLKESIKSQETANKELAVETHNKAVEAQQTSTNAIVDSIEGLRESNISAAEKASEGGGQNGNGATTGGGGDGEEGECSTPDGCTSSVELRQEPSDGLEGFWESEYEDGVEGMFQGKIDELKATEFFLFLDEFKPQISGGAAPMFNWCFNFGRYMNFGCQTVNIDPRVFPALKVFFLLSSAFACRQILFGG